MLRSPPVALALVPLLAGCPSDEPIPEPAGHPFTDHGEVLCDDPYEGFDRFTERAAERGIAPAAIDSGLPEGIGTMTAAAVDADLDGDVDLFFSHPEGAPQTFANDGTGSFTEVVQPNVPPTSLGQFNPTGVFALADLTGDGLPDLVTAGFGTLMFAPNLGDLVFGDFGVIETSPADHTFVMTVALGDVDGDGDLDFHLPGLDRWINGQQADPPGSRSRLYLNDGETFVFDRELGLAGNGEGLSVIGALTDRDGDGDLDIYVLSDRAQWGYPASAFYRNDGNDGDGRPVLVDDAAEIGADLVMSGMGVDVADLNGDGDYDYCISDVGRPKCLLSDGGGGFVESSLALGLDVPPLDEGQEWSGWATDLTDLDNDGDLDLAVAGGFPTAGPGSELEGDFSNQPDALWERTDGGFVLRSGETGYDSPHQHYGGAAADLDNDGFPELVVYGPLGDVHVLWNRCGDGAWLDVELAGLPPNPAAIGARIEVIAAAGDDDVLAHVREVQGPRGVGQGPNRAHFGLGDAEVVELLRVTWPDGVVTESEWVPVRRRVTVAHPDRDEAAFGGWAWGGVVPNPGDATLEGTITRSIDPGGDGVGTLFVQLYPDDPQGAGIPPVAEWSAVAVDVTDPGFARDYEVSGVPPREDPYFLFAFLDDDSNGHPSPGDAMAVGAGGLHTVALTEDGATVELDLDLNFVMAR